MLARLLALVFPVREDEAIVAALNEADVLALLSPELDARTDPAAVSLMPFADRRVRALIHEAKYHGSPRAFALLATLLGEYLHSLAEESDLSHAVLAPIPLSDGRLRTRGYNQVEEVMRRALKKSNEGLGTYRPHLLVRTRETTSQVLLPRRARKRNMRRAFCAAAPLDPRPLYLLVDDVLTTGATLQAAADALREAGAEELILLALAH